MEGDLDPGYISALAAQAGAAIADRTLFARSWSKQRTQVRRAHRRTEGAGLKALYGDFITAAAANGTLGPCEW